MLEKPGYEHRAQHGHAAQPSRAAYGELLAADRALVIAALLDNLLLQEEKVLSASTLEERLTRDIEALRAQGYELPFAATAWEVVLI